jgi:hypothetical protein
MKAELDFLAPLAAALKVCEMCLARVFRGFWILDLCTTHVRVELKPQKGSAEWGLGPTK